MAERTPDDSAAAARASNAVLRALQDTASETSPEAAVALVLEHARAALSAERAFLVEECEASDGPRVLGVAGDGPPSRTAARHVLTGGRATLADSPSVRALDLRAVLGALLPERTTRRRALVLDSRNGTPAPAETAPVLEGFAVLLGLVAAPMPPRPPAGSDGWVGSSSAYLALLDEIAAVAASTLPVLISGESGTGKEGVARRIHTGGPRRSGPFVAVNCAALPEALLEAELFGSTRGAYTGADRDRDGLFVAACGGTLFLDEVGDMPPAMQAKLLRVLQEGRVRAVGSSLERGVDVRILAASHRDLRRAAARGGFRADLLYRLAMLEVRVPPLRERLSDLPRLVPFVLDKLAARAGIPCCRVSPDALAALRLHDWPGNVRELEAVLARAAVRSGGGTLGAEHLGLKPAVTAALELSPDAHEPLEAAMIRAALATVSGSMTLAAARIGWTRQKLYRRMVALGIAAGSSSTYPRSTPREPTVMDSRDFDLLLVEPDLAGVEVFHDAIRQPPALPGKLHVVATGEEALAFLARRGRWSAAPVPSMVLLSARRADALDGALVGAITQMRQAQSLPVPVQVFGPPLSRTEMDRAYCSFVSAYTVIPPGRAEHVRGVREALEYWLTRVLLPRRHSDAAIDVPGRD